MATQLVERTAVRFKVRCWGDFALSDAITGEERRPRGRKARALIAYLVMHPNKRIGREKLAGMLWGERGEEQARASLRQSLFELRDLASGDRPLLVVDRESVLLDGDIIETDLENIAASAEAGAADTLLAALPEPDELLFSNLDGIDPGFDDWLRVERTRQRDALAPLLADVSARTLAAGRVRTSRALHARLREFSSDPGEAPPAPAPANAASFATPARAIVARGLRWPVVAGSTLLLAIAGLGTAALVRAPDAPGRAEPQVRALYEPAHAIIYERKEAQYPVALSLLRRAVALNADYAPAVTDLAAVTGMVARTPAQRAEAERLARRAVALDPESGLAQGVLGMVLQFETPEARSAIKRAARLDASDPQVQFWLSNVLAVEGNYTGRLQALRRAVALDPRLHRATGTAAMAAWELGHVGEAETHAARLREFDLSASFFCTYALDWYRGHYADAVTNVLAVRDRLTEADAADWKLGIGYLVLGHLEPARLLLRLPPSLWRVASGAGPAPGELETILIEAESDPRAAFFSLTALRQVLKARRAAEIVAAYDRQAGMMGRLGAADAPNSLLAMEGVQVAQALMAVGRTEEGAALLSRADAAVRKSLAYGDIPNWMYAGAASVWAVQGREREALSALETAVRRGWKYAPMTPMPDLGEVPSFEKLRGHPRFERLRRELLDHMAAERRKLGSVRV